MKVLSVMAIGLMFSLGVIAVGQSDYPNREINNVVVFGATGGTDIANRFVANEMNKVLPVRINISNKPGGVSGSLGMSYVLSQPADGYTLAGISESVVTAGVLGGWTKKMNVWYPFIIGASPLVITVPSTSPYKTLEDLIADAKQRPNTIRAAASALGSIHHINLLAFMRGMDIKLTYVPHTGSGPAQNAALSGEVGVLISSVAEANVLIRNNRLRPLATMTFEDFEVTDYGTIPSAIKKYPVLDTFLPIHQAIGFAVRNDAPKVVKDTLEVAFNKAMNSDSVKFWAKANYFVLNGKVGKPAQEAYKRLESLFSWTLWDLGAAKISPERLLIPRPTRNNP
jgi:tripartite-type tricarboxylate transporter receptor subunit TctC